MSRERWEEVYDDLIERCHVTHSHQSPDQSLQEGDALVIDVACKRIAQLEAERAELVEIVRELKGVMDDSEGVAGWHRNGVVADWREFEFYDAAVKILAKHKEQA